MRIEYRPENGSHPWFAVRTLAAAEYVYACRTEAGAQAKIRQWQWDEHCARWLAERLVRAS